MKKQRIFLFLVLALTTLRAAAQDSKPFIEVTGTAEKLVVPDEIYIHITLREQSGKKEKESIQAQEERLMAALKEAGINLSEMYLTDADANYVRIRRKTGEVLTSKSFMLMVRKVPEVAKVFVILDKLDISDAEIDRVDHSAMDSYRREVRIAAIKAAKAKADYLLTAIDQKTGKALIVQEREDLQAATGLNIRYKNNYMANSTLEGYTPGKGDELKYDKITINASVYVKFQIE